MADLHILLQAGDGLGEADRQIQAKIIALAGPTAPGPTRRCRATEAAEEGFEQIGETAHVAHIGHARRSPQTGFTELVVAGAGLGIAQHLIGTTDLLEFVLRTGILVDVRVVLTRQAAVSPLQSFGVGVATDAQQLVVIGHQPPCSWRGSASPLGPGPIDTLTRAWRSTVPLS